MNTFIWKNGRPDHQGGFHDDTVTAMAMGLYVLQFSFKRLQAVKQKNVAILKSMVAAQNAVNGMLPEGKFDINAKKPAIPFYMAGGSVHIKEIPKEEGQEEEIQMTAEQINAEIKREQNRLLNIYLNNQMNRQMNNFMRR